MMCNQFGTLFFFFLFSYAQTICHLINATLPVSLIFIQDAALVHRKDLARSSLLNRGQYFSLQFNETVKTALAEHFDHISERYISAY